MTYEWLLFDADGTLYDYNSAEFGALIKTFRDAGLDCSNACQVRYRQINNRMFRDLEAGRMTSQELRTRRFERFFSEFHIDLDVRTFSADYLHNLSECSMLVPGALQTIQSLHPRHRMLLVTNGIADVQRRRFSRSPISTYFAGVIISDEVGVAKPNPEFFEMAFDLMGEPQKNEVLIIGDSLTSDMAGGIGFGIDTCWYNPYKLPKDAEMDITYEIGALEELLAIVYSAPQD